MVHPSNPAKPAFVCDHCKKSYKQKHWFINHVCVPGGKLSTSRCSRRKFSAKCAVVDSEDKPFQCKTCKKTFADRSNCNRHIRTHTDKKKRFRCRQCHQTFAIKRYLVQHIRKHSNPRQQKTASVYYTCDLCKKSYSRKSSLVVHMRTHTGDKPFKCELCEKRFLHVSHVKRHLRTHTGEKPFECDNCKAEFSDKSDLIKHIHVYFRKKDCKKYRKNCKKNRKDCKKYRKDCKRYRRICENERKNVSYNTKLSDDEISIGECKMPFDFEWEPSSFVLDDLDLLDFATALYNCLYCRKSYVKKSDLLYHIQKYYV